MNDGFEEISHTADTGIRAQAATLSGVLEQAATGMFSLIFAQSTDLRPSGSEEVQISAASGEELLQGLLSELLFLNGLRRSVPVAYVLSATSPGHAAGEVAHRNDEDETARAGRWRCRVTYTYAEMTAAMQMQATEIKAVTWHGLKLCYDDRRWQAEVIFDT